MTRSRKVRQRTTCGATSAVKVRNLHLKEKADNPQHLKALLPQERTRNTAELQLNCPNHYIFHHLLFSLKKSSWIKMGRALLWNDSQKGLYCCFEPRRKKRGGEFPLSNMNGLYSHLMISTFRWHFFFKLEFSWNYSDETFLKSHTKSQ